jgi:hypothetical protein
VIKKKESAYVWYSPRLPRTYREWFGFRQVIHLEYAGDSILPRHELNRHPIPSKRRFSNY